MLNIGQASARGPEIAAFTVPTEDGAIRSQGLSAAFEGIAGQNYDEACDCITDTRDRHGLHRGQRHRLLSSTRTAIRSPRAGRSASASRTSSTSSPTRPSPRRSSRSSSGTSRSRCSYRLTTFALGLAAGHGVQQRAAEGTADLPIAADPAVRHARLRDAAGLAGHVQHRLRRDQPDVRAERQLVRRPVDRPSCGAASSSCGWASRTCSWSAPVRCSRSRPIWSRRPGWTAPNRPTPSGPSPSRCCWWPPGRC